MSASCLSNAVREITASYERVLAAAGSEGLAPAALQEVTGLKTILTLALLPVQDDPVSHLIAAHTEVRPYLVRLLQHEPAREILADRGRFSYTPRKILRRILDHALDHLNQIDQWIIWQEQGVAPTPTDGWASSSVTLADDRHSLCARELQAWLWRIDQAARLVVQRARGLTEAQLDWQPPDGGWPLRRVLHHLAHAERLYGTALENLLPEAPLARYCEVSRRFHERLQAAANAPPGATTIYVHPNGERYAPERAIQQGLDAERQLQV